MRACVCVCVSQRSSAASRVLFVHAVAMVTKISIMTASSYSWPCKSMSLSSADALVPEVEGAEGPALGGESTSAEVSVAAGEIAPVDAAAPAQASASRAESTGWIGRERVGIHSAVK